MILHFREFVCAVGQCPIPVPPMWIITQRRSTRSNVCRKHIFRRAVPEPHAVGQCPIPVPPGWIVTRRRPTRTNVCRKHIFRRAVPEPYAAHVDYCPAPSHADERFPETYISSGSARSLCRPGGLLPSAVPRDQTFAGNMHFVGATNGRPYGYCSRIRALSARIVKQFNAAQQTNKKGVPERFMFQYPLNIVYSIQFIHPGAALCCAAAKKPIFRARRGP